VDDPFHLERFVVAQDRGDTYRHALAEIRRAAKDTHWMWFVFPQVAGLGTSATSREYAITSLAEARAYLAHPVLGPRLREITAAATGHVTRSARDIFSYDDVKFHSSMTLFARAAPDETLFRGALDQFFAGLADTRTDQRLGDDRITGSER
jgi:uncharacterized protein (DUF1810 family)